MKILTLCGSLRARSVNRALLRAFARLAPAGFVVQPYEPLGRLPHFNPDMDGEMVAAEVVALRSAVTGADALVVSTPEYAHGLPGSFKNALDWLVSDPTFAGKPIVILHASRGSTWALDSLTEVLRTMSARIVGPACVALPLESNQLDETAILARANCYQLLLDSVTELERHLKSQPR